MRLIVADFISLCCAIAGWYYLFYSKAAARLAPIESPRLNIQRTRLRRICGAAMFALAVSFFAGFNTVDEHSHGAYALVWLIVLVLVAVILILAMADLRLTRKLREGSRSADRQ
jgi:peptidoglycan/LPS O-acetylase OafA/YrhL